MQAQDILSRIEIPDPAERAAAFVALIPRLKNCPENTALVALQSIDSVEDVSKRDGLLTNLLPFLPPALLPKAVELSENGPPRRSQVTFMMKLAERTSDEVRKHLVGQSLELAFGLQDLQSRNHVLAEVAPYLNEAQRDEVLKLVVDMQDEYLKAGLLEKLASSLNDRQRNLAITLAGTLGGRSSPSYESVGPHSPREQVLIALAPNLTAAQVVRAMETISTLDPHQCTRTLLDLAPFAGERRGEILDKAVEQARQIPRMWLRALVLTQEFPWLSAAERTPFANEALTCALAIEEENSRRRAVCDLVPHIPDRDILLRALASVERIHDDEGRADVLVALLTRLGSEDVRKVLDVAFRLESAVALARVAVAAIGHTEGRSMEREIARVFRSAWRSKDSVESATALALLAPSLGKFRGLAAEVRIYFAILSRDGSDRSEAIASLAPHMRPQRFELMLRLAVETGLDYVVMDVIEAMGPNLRAEQIPAAFAAARTIEEPIFRARSLLALVSHLDEGERREVMRAILHVPSDSDRCHLLESMTPYLSTELLDSALESEWPRGTHDVSIYGALAAPAARYNSRQLDRVLSKAADFQTDTFRGLLIGALVPFLSETQMTLARRFVMQMESANARFESLLAMAGTSVPTATESELRHAFVECLGSDIVRGDAETLLGELDQFLGKPAAARLPPPAVCLIATDVLDVARWRWV